MDRTFSRVLDIEHKMLLQEEKEDQRTFLQNAIRSLTVRQKEALLLRLDNGMSNREIADIMEISDKRVRNLIYEAIKRLKEHIYKTNN